MCQGGGQMGTHTKRTAPNAISLFGHSLCTLVAAVSWPLDREIIFLSIESNKNQITWPGDHLDRQRRRHSTHCSGHQRRRAGVYDPIGAIGATAELDRTSGSALPAA